jgi:pseudoazurin
LIRTMKLAMAMTTLALVGAAPAPAPRQWQVQMLNKGPDGQLMVFSPAKLAIAPGDSVKFVATDKGHNAESIAGMIPAGATPFKGAINQEIVVKFDRAGMYGYKCLPHLGLGMVGVIQVGNAANRAQLQAEAAKLPGIGKKRMTALLAG